MTRATAYVSWIVCQQPWELEDNLIAALDLPLNLMGNAHNQVRSALSEVRARCAARARELPMLPNPGTRPIGLCLFLGAVSRTCRPLTLNQRGKPRTAEVRAGLRK
jgi:hypothetical protein